MMKSTVSRRDFLAGGSLVVSFSMFGVRGLAQSAPSQPEGPPFGDLKMYPYLDSWIGIDETDAVTVFSGAELGQGVETAFLQCAAEQLAVEPEAITMVMASTTHAERGLHSGQRLDDVRRHRDFPRGRSGARHPARLGGERAWCRCRAAETGQRRHQGP
jgi:CO/xanthine dehydrogenase Mo-binding subunit